MIGGTRSRTAPPHPAPAASGEEADPPYPTAPAAPPGRDGGAPRPDRLGRSGNGRRRAGWSVADQALSSLTNFGLAVLVARAASVGEFGAFELTYSLYFFLVGASRALGSEPLLVRYSDASATEVRPAIRDATGTAVVVGGLAGLACIAVAQLAGDPTRGAIMALGLTLPGLLLQDAWRFAFFACGRPAKATCNDGLWAVAQLGFVAWLLVGEDPPLSHLVLAWGLSGALGAGLGIVQSGVLPNPAAAVRWVRGHRDLAPRFLGEFGVGLGAASSSLWLVGLVGGLGVLGALRAAMVVLGPFRIFLAAAPGATIPELIRLRNRSVPRFLVGVVAIGIVLAVLIAAWGVLGLFLPDEWGVRLLGANWSAAEPLLLPVTVSWSALGLVTAAMIGLRSLGDARRSFRARVTVAPLVIAAPVTGAALGGAEGAAWAIAAVSLASAVLWGIQFRASLDEADPDARRTWRQRSLTGASPLPGEAPVAVAQDVG